MDQQNDVRGRSWRVLGPARRHPFRVVVLTTLVAIGALAGPGSAGANPSGVSAHRSALTADRLAPGAIKPADQVASACPGLVSQHPDATPRAGAFYGIPVAAKVTNGALTVGGAVHSVGVNSTICGYFVLPSMALDSSPVSTPACPGCSISFTGSEANIYNSAALPLTVTPTGPVTGQPLQQLAANGGLILDLNAPISANVGVPQLGVNCGVPITASLSTDPARGGQAITGPITDATSQVVSNNLTVPAIQPSTTCPNSLAVPFGQVAGLPAGGGAANFSGGLQLDLSLLGDAR